MYRTRKTKKSRNIKRHFRSRCVERLGFPLSESDIVEKIQKNTLMFVRRTSNTRTVFRYSINSKNYNIIYDKLRHLVVTIYEVKNKVLK